MTGADLTNAHFTNANLEGTVLKEAILSGSSSGAVTGTPESLPSEWTLVDGYLIGPEASLTYANLMGAKLAGANLSKSLLTRANLVGADLTGANLSEADLTSVSLTDACLIGVISHGINGTPAELPSGWRLVNGEFVTSRPSSHS